MVVFSIDGDSGDSNVDVFKVLVVLPLLLDDEEEEEDVRAGGSHWVTPVVVST